MWDVCYAVFLSGVVPFNPILPAAAVIHYYMKMIHFLGMLIKTNTLPLNLMKLQIEF